MRIDRPRPPPSSSATMSLGFVHWTRHHFRSSPAIRWSIFKSQDHRRGRTSLPELPPNDLDDFQNCLVCLGTYCGMVRQTGVFTGRKVDEKREFQQHLLQYLRGRLGEDVREEETLAGGRPDLRYRRIVIELKVEDTTKDRDMLRRKYTEQPTQYAAPSIPLGVVCILDMTGRSTRPRISPTISPWKPRPSTDLRTPLPLPYENRGCDHRRQSEAT